MESKLFYKKYKPIDDWHSLFTVNIGNYHVSIFLQEEDIQPIVDEVFLHFESKEQKWGDKTIELGCAPKGNIFYSDNGRYKLIDDDCLKTRQFMSYIVNKYNYIKHDIIPVISQNNKNSTKIFGSFWT